MPSTSEIRRSFRDRLGRRPVVVAPGTGDALGVRLIEQAGFEAVYMSGYVVAANHGLPDMGLLGGWEMAERAAQLADASDLPVVADADDGYGGVGNVVRAVRAFERAGVAALHIEDQAAPKRCGSMQGKRLVSATEMCAKIGAALDSRRDSNLLMMVRTDSLAVEGFDAMQERIGRYVEAGAEMLLVHGPYDEPTARKIVAEAPAPVAYFCSETLTMPILPSAQLDEMGVPLALYPLSMLFAGVHAMRAALEVMRKGEGTGHLLETSMVDAATMNAIVKVPELKTLEDKVTRAAETLTAKERA